MKKNTEVFGFILAIIIALSSIAKANHYPGAGVGLSLGLGVLFFPFLILFTITLYRETKSIIPLIFGSFSALIYLTGFLFLIQHWSGGRLFLFAGLLMLLITLIITGLTELARQPENRKYSVIAISFIIMAVSLIYAASFRTVGRGVLNGLITSNEELMKSTEMIWDSYKDNYDKFYVTHPNKAKIFLSLRDKSNELSEYIEAIKKKLAAAANGGSDYSSYSNVNGLDVVDISNVYMIGNGYASQLKNQINKYKEFVVENDSTFHMKEVIHNFLDVLDPPSIECENTTWESSKFLNVPLICSISNLSAIQLNLRTFEMYAVRFME